MPVSNHCRPAPCFPALGPSFFDVVAPAAFPEHRLRFRNQRWAERVGLGELDPSEWEQHFAAFAPLPGNLEEPLALRYHGHQFRVYNPHLGDGRGFLYAQLLDAQDGRLLDLGTKGSGRTPWSRDGDGRLTLKGGVREVLATEMLEALGAYTSKSFSLFETGEKLFRTDEPSPTRSSVLVRLSHSHIRFGTFQRYAHRHETNLLRRLLDFAVRHYLPEVADTNAGNTPAAFLREVSRRSAVLCASWMVAGFVHGVLNSDNMNITGESFDYGPYRFLPTYDPSFVAAYFDHHGLYAFARQPTMVRWNLEQLAEALSHLSPRSPLESSLKSFEAAFDAALVDKFLAKLGLIPRDPDRDSALVDASYRFLAESQVCYEQFFFDWYGGAASAERAAASPAAEKYAGSRFEALRRIIDDYSPLSPEQLDTAYYQRTQPCRLLIDEIEAIWEAIAARDDWALFQAKLDEIGKRRDSAGSAAEQ
jgi:protein adenylyltransferase